MATFKTITAADIQTTTSTLNQLVDVIQEDISGSSSRKKYQVFVTGGVGPGVTSSLFQTVYDQDFSLQTANAVLDMTVGLFTGSNTVQTSTTGQDANGKYLFPSQSVMMREKINLYKQYAQLLLGSADSQFAAPFGNTTETNKINNALFLSFKRLFSRDGIKRETFAMKFYQSASRAPGAGGGFNPTIGDMWGMNLFITMKIHFIANIFFNDFIDRPTFLMPKNYTWTFFSKMK